MKDDERETLNKWVQEVLGNVDEGRPQYTPEVQKANNQWKKLSKSGDWNELAREDKADRLKRACIDFERTRQPEIDRRLESWKDKDWLLWLDVFEKEKDNA